MTIRLLTRSDSLEECCLQLENLDDCQALAQHMAKGVVVPLAIALSGTLGAGKTQWTRFFAMALGAPAESISSPTFMLVHQYPSTPPIFHLDAYRVGDEDEMLDLGLEEMFDADAITIVEWADRFPSLLPRDTIELHFSIPADPEGRWVQVRGRGPKGKRVVEQWISAWS